MEKRPQVEEKKRRQVLTFTVEKCDYFYELSAKKLAERGRKERCYAFFESLAICFPKRLQVKSAWAQDKKKLQR